MRRSRCVSFAAAVIWRLSAFARDLRQTSICYGSRLGKPSSPSAIPNKNMAGDLVSPPAGKYLAGYAGHSLCVDYFGAPSEEEAPLGLPLHGEVASSRWTLVKKRSQARAGAA